MEPRNFQEACKDPLWVEAMRAEIQALEDNRTWRLVTLPPRKLPIGCKWVFKIKHKVDGSIKRYKARLVAKGYNQQEGIDYNKIFSPIVKIMIVRSLLSVAAIEGRHVYQINIYNAFLQGDLPDEVYMQLPEGFASQGRIQYVCLSNPFMD